MLPRGAQNSSHFFQTTPRALAMAVTGGESLTDEVSFSEQLLQVIDDLIRMLPAAQRLTLKDFPYAVAQTAGEAPRSSAAKKHFLTVFFVWEVVTEKKKEKEREAEDRRGGPKSALLN